MPDTLGDREWSKLLRRIMDKKCTPFIGAGACQGILPLGSEIARQWAEEYNYPLADSGDLARVSQFLAVDQDDMFPKECMGRCLAEVGPPDFSAPDEPHAILADLNLPIYITTNYDNFMLRALESRRKAPKQEFCRWNNFPEVMGVKSLLESGYEPNEAEPLVYHLHGYCELPQSVVLTEDDYLDFLVRLSRDQDLLPPVVRTALAGTSLLFVGYSLGDWNFRVLFRGLISSLGASLGYSSIAVQLPPDDLSRERLQRAQEYLDLYFDQIQRIKVRVYWGDVHDFATELRERWEAFSHDI